MERNKYQNTSKMISESKNSWRVAEEMGLAGLSVSHSSVPFMKHGAKELINMCSCSYLGWDRHPAILEGAIKGVEKAGTLHLTTARCRLVLDVLKELESELSVHFGGTAVIYNSCAAASSAALPLLASGCLTRGVKPIMAFDRFAHFSIAHMKPLCGDETEVVTLPNNDMDQLESLCQKHDQVAYISDATYSISGHANFSALKELQRKYGLFLYLDDSHGLSITGSRGEGSALQALGRPNDRTILVASLAKAYGGAGGLLLSGIEDIRGLVSKYGNAWSQYLNTAGIGGCLASLKLHQSDELANAQAKWRRNLRVFDSNFKTQGAGSMSPIRILPVGGPSDAVMMASEVLNEGYYTSAVFFPVVAKGGAALRLMPRADLTERQMQEFCNVLADAKARLSMEGE